MGVGTIDRHRARVLAMQALCQLDAQGEEYRQRVTAFLADEGARGPTATYAQSLIDNAWRDRDVHAAELARNVANWSMERLTPVDRNVFRVALAEFDLAEAPPKVIINEALEIANEYGSADSSRFLNGVLDAIWKAQQYEA